MSDFEERYLKPLASLGTLFLFMVALFLGSAAIVWVLENYFLTVSCVSSLTIGLLAGFGIGGRVYRK